jgi:hypothetical protein
LEVMIFAFFPLRTCQKKYHPDQGDIKDKRFSSRQAKWPGV